MPIPMKETDADRSVKERVKSQAQREIEAFVNRIEAVLEGIAEAKEDLKAVYDELKDQGYSVPAMKRVIRDRTKDVGDLQHENWCYQAYAEAVGLKHEPVAEPTHEDQSGSRH